MRHRGAESGGDSASDPAMVTIERGGSRAAEASAWARCPRGSDKDRVWPHYVVIAVLFCVGFVGSSVPMQGLSTQPDSAAGAAHEPLQQSLADAGVRVPPAASRAGDTRLSSAGADVPLDDEFSAPQASAAGKETQALYDWVDRKLPSPNSIGGPQWASVVGTRKARDLVAASVKHRTLTAIVDFAKRRVDSHGSVVLTVVTQEAANDLLLNWLATTILSAETRNIVVVSFDPESAKYLTQLGATAFHVDGSLIADRAGAEIKRFSSSLGRLGAVSRIWVARYYVTLALVANGINVLQCDLDALLLRPIMPALLATKADIVAQRGHKPVPMSSKLGSAACGGLTFFRANNRTLRVLTEGMGGLYMYGDDQSAVAWGILGGEETPARALSWWSVKHWYESPDGPYTQRSPDHHAQEYRGAAIPVDATELEPSSMSIAVVDIPSETGGGDAAEPVVGLDAATGEADAPVSIGFLPYREFPRRQCERVAVADREWIGPHCQGASRGFKGHGTPAKALAMADLALWWMPLPTVVSTTSVQLQPVKQMLGPSATEEEFVRWLTRRVLSSGWEIPLRYTGEKIKPRRPVQLFSPKQGA